jgi:hypothetical protein
MRPGAINGHFHRDACAPLLDDEDDRIARQRCVSVHDHIIVGKNGHASLKGLKLI